MRGVWLTVNHALDWPKNAVQSTADIDRQKADLDRMLDRFEKAGINVIFFQVRFSGNVIYPSLIEPVSEYFNSEHTNYDPLAYAIEACRRRRMECHAWMAVYPVGNSTVKKGKKRYAAPVPPRYKGIAKSYNGGLYLDPGNPQTTDYLLRLIREMVSAYDLDGVHFDYIRYPTGSGQFPDNDTYRRYGQGKTKAEWRRENINRFVYAAYDEVKALKPWVQVSSAVVGMYNTLPTVTHRHWTAFHNVYQDPADWLQKGKHDFVVPMMYYSGDLFFPFVDDWQERSGGRFVVPGLGLYQMDAKEFGWEPDVLLEQIRYSRDRRTQGNVFFRALHLVENRRGICDEIVSRFYATPAVLPALTWLSRSIPATPQHVYACESDDSLLLTWDNVAISEMQEKTIFYNVYRSNTFPVDTTDPRNLIAARMENNSCKIPIDNRFGLEHYYVVTSYDRYHNESAVSAPVYTVNGKW
ncbi:MAG: family 10 glycosylhydrolase [Dysgonamonadaceae bacterium]|jgi:uncharacterized lipoprotein YddW (UPF0748 family)|nr:family 10 glycosylhydrolase [Dysgonamonadaceae bacterium]